MDILAAVTIELPCGACGGSYEMTLREIELHQQALHEGCLARFETECSPIFYGDLFHRRQIDEFTEAWRHLEEAARAAGGRLSVRGTDQQGGNPR